jgi:hypothetical protein
VAKKMSACEQRKKNEETRGGGEESITHTYEKGKERKEREKPFPLSLLFSMFPFLL